MLPANHHNGSPSAGDQALARAVPGAAVRVLVVGCGGGPLGAALKAQRHNRQIFAIEPDPDRAQDVGAVLNQVFIQDIERENPPLEAGSVHCIVYGEMLRHFADPAAVLRRHRGLLSAEGCIVARLPNAQHFSKVAALMRGDCTDGRAGPHDARHARSYTISTMLKLLLDGGYAPSVLEDVRVPCPNPVFDTIRPLLAALDLHPARTRRYLDAREYVLRGDRLTT